MSLSYLFTAYAARIPMQVNNISKFSFGIRKMALDLGNLLGGVTNATTALSKETLKNEDGTDFHPTIAELCSVIETTYTRP